MADYTLSKQISYKFLEEILKIKNPANQQTNSTKLDFLTKIIGNWYEYVPFQNIDQLSLTMREKRLATVPEIINYHLKGRGGVCLYNAVFIYLLLKSLDYKIHITVGSIFDKNDHAICVAKDVVEPGDSYLVEIGSGWPCFEPIPLHNLPTDLSSAKVYRNSFVTYTYVREGDLVVRYHRKDYMENTSALRADGWWKNGWTDLKPVDIDFLYSKEATIWKTCTDVTSFGLTRIWVVVSYPGKKGRVVKCRMVAWEENGEKKSRNLVDKCEIIENIKKIVPLLDEGAISEAIDFVDENIRLYGEN